MADLELSTGKSVPWLPRISATRGDAEAIDDLEVQADDDYYRIVPDDSALQDALEARYDEDPGAFDAV